MKDADGRCGLSNPSTGHQLIPTEITVARRTDIPSRAALVRQGTLPGGRVALYRAFDADGRLLWVGITENVLRRQDQHRVESPWYPLAARWHAQVYPDRATARAAEITAIWSEDPVYNKLNRRKAA